MIDMKTGAALGGVVLICALGSAAFILSDVPGADRGVGQSSEFRGNTPNPANDMMKVVGKTEADRRAGVNRQAADEKAGVGKNYVAPTVVSESRAPQLGDMPDANPAPEAKPAEPR